MKPATQPVTHDSTRMRYLGRFPRKSRPTQTFRNGKNIWFAHYHCEFCGKKHRIHINFVPAGKSPYCDGRKRVQWISREDADTVRRISHAMEHESKAGQYIFVKLPRHHADAAHVLRERDHAHIREVPDSQDGRAELLRVGAGGTRP